MNRETNILNEARNTLVAYLRHRGMRRTPERFAILEKVYETNSHFFADSLSTMLEADGYHVSLATIYATLHLLADAGLVRQHRFADQPTQYERVALGMPQSHYHIVCSTCGKVREVRDEELLRQLTTRRQQTFRPDYCMVYVYGQCGNCQKRLRKIERERRRQDLEKRAERIRQSEKTDKAMKPHHSLHNSEK